MHSFSLQRQGDIEQALSSFAHAADAFTAVSDSLMAFTSLAWAASIEVHRDLQSPSDDDWSAGHESALIAWGIWKEDLESSTQLPSHPLYPLFVEAMVYLAASLAFTERERAIEATAIAQRLTVETGYAGLTASLPTEREIDEAWGQPKP